MEAWILKSTITTRTELYAWARSNYAGVSRERWFTLTLAEQMGNIGSEVGRAAKWQGKDEQSFWGAVTRALELLDLTREDPRWAKRRPELDRARESVADAALGGLEYRSSLASLERYFMPFALRAATALQ